jgi:hypothetical protein
MTRGLERVMSLRRDMSWEELSMQACRVAWEVAGQAGEDFAVTKERRVGMRRGIFMASLEKVTREGGRGGEEEKKRREVEKFSVL